jgi:16S rRNA processing protein RimM
MPQTRILMGVIGRPHGVRGLVHVHSYTAEPSDLARYNPLLDEAGRAWSLAWRGEGVAELRDGAGRAIADRTEAERLVNTRFYVERHRLPEADSEEFYLADLVGLAAHDMAGALVGEVTAVHDYGAGTSLEIARTTAGPLVVPFTRKAVPQIDVSAGRLVVVPPAEVELREVAA